jgi:phosphatidate cytidylyltransferase
MKKRVISAAILVAIVIVIFLLPESISLYAIAVAAGLMGALAFKETLGLTKSHKPYPKLMVGIGFLCMELMIFNHINPSYLYYGPSMGIIGLITLLTIIPSIFYKKEKYTTRDALYLLGTTILIGLFFNSLMLLFLENKWLLLYLVLIATMTDTFAMLIGCLIGKHKLIPEVSPKKSIEGSIAGSIVGTAIASIYYINILDTNINLIVLLVMSLILSILGQIGDLFFSKMKRENEIKDFSNLMPGHGGILDRFDSLSFIIFGYIVIFHILSII